MRRTVGTVAAVEPGIEIWSKGRVHIERGQEQPVGGIVLYVTEALDQETGELRRAFVCLDHTRTQPYLRWSTIDEGDVDPDTAQTADLSTFYRLLRRLGFELAFNERRRPRRGPVTSEEARIIEAIGVLGGLLFASDGRLHGVLARPVPQRRADDRSSPPAAIGALCD